MSTPAPTTTKSSKTPRDRPYHLFECVKKRTAKSTKAPTPAPNTSPGRKLQTTSPPSKSKTSKSSKCTKSPKSATPAPTTASTPASDSLVEPKPVNEGVVEIVEYPKGAVTLVPGSSGTASGSGELGPTTADGPVTLLFDANGNNTATEGEGVTLASGSAAGGAGDSCVVESSSQPDGTSVELPLTYQVVMKDGASADVLDRLDYVLTDLAASGVFGCSRRTLQSSADPFHSGGRALEDLGCVAINSDPTETATGAECTVTYDTSENICDVVEGGVTLIIADTSSGDVEAKGDAAKDKASGAILAAASSGTLTDPNSSNYVPGLVSITMNPAAAPAPVTTAPDSNIERSEAATAPISTAGAVVLGLGLIAFIALALLAFRHKRKRGSAYNEFDDDFDDDLVVKETSSTTDGSLDDILRDLDNAYGNQVDVHQCNSAMCQICNPGRQTVFIDTGDNDTVSEMYPDQFEVGDRNRSFEYMAKPGAARPRFDNPANIRPRLYEADDSVDL